MIEMNSILSPEEFNKYSEQVSLIGKLERRRKKKQEKKISPNLRGFVPSE
jgi:hypothetical protein